MQHFPAAPWPKALKVSSGIATVLLAGVEFGATKTIPPYGLAHLVGTLVAWLPPALLAGAGLFAVTGYDADASTLRVRRLLWSTVIPLEGLTRVWHDPQAIRHSIKVFGNGGMFAFTGLYRSKTLGRYRLFATDPASAVVLQLARRTLVITPSSPHAFVQYLGRALPGGR
ncbi:MAG TPA: PH domain-containing protein [Burkholderiales bacterium]|nr:PH domain-containing protein [Burkholderiales bacterium]